MEVFLKSGFNGARMQEIADIAGVNKAMLHYYFSSKEQLFDKVFSDAMLTLIPELDAIISSDRPLIEKMKAFVTLNFRQHQKHPQLLQFVFNELANNPERMQSHVKCIDPFNKYISYFGEQYLKEVASGNFKEYPLMQLVVIIQGLTEYYHLSRPFLAPFLGQHRVILDKEFEDNLLDQILIILEQLLLNK